MCQVCNVNVCTVTHLSASMPFFCRVRTHGAFLWLGLGLPAGFPPQRESPSRQLPPSCARQALTRGVLRGSGGTQHQSVMVKDLNEYRTTICCSKCGGRTTAPLVWLSHTQAQEVHAAPWVPSLQTAGARGWGWGSTSGGWGGRGSTSWVWWGRGSSGGRGPCSSPGTERKCEENTACVPDAQRPKCGMEPMECFGCGVC